MSSRTMSHNSRQPATLGNAMVIEINDIVSGQPQQNYDKGLLLGGKRAASSAGKELPKGTAGRYRFIGDAEFQSLTPSPHPLTPPFKQSRFVPQEQLTTRGRRSRSSLSDDNVSPRVSAERQLPSTETGQISTTKAITNGASGVTPKMQPQHASPDSLESGGTAVMPTSTRSSVTPQPPPRQLSTRKSLVEQQVQTKAESKEPIPTENTKEKSLSPAGVHNDEILSGYEERAIDVGSLEGLQKLQDQLVAVDSRPASAELPEKLSAIEQGVPTNRIEATSDEAMFTAVVTVRPSAIMPPELKSATLDLKAHPKPNPHATFEHLDIQVRHEKPSSTRPVIVRIKRSETSRHSARPGIIQRVTSIFGRSLRSPPPAPVLHRTNAITNVRRRSSCPIAPQLHAKPDRITSQQSFVNVQRHVAALTGTEMVVCANTPPEASAVTEAQSMHSMLSSPASTIATHYRSTLMSPTATINASSNRAQGGKHETYIVASTVTTKTKTQLPSPISQAASQPPTANENVGDEQRLNNTSVARSVSEHVSLASHAASTVRTETSAAASVNPIGVVANNNDAELCELDWPTYTITPQTLNYTDSIDGTIARAPQKSTPVSTEEMSVQPVAVKMRPKNIFAAAGSNQQHGDAGLTAAIHFGETYSSAGFSWQNRTEAAGGQKVQRHDDILARYACSDPLNSRQCLSAILFDKKTHKLHQFGYQARNTWLSMPQKTRGRYLYVKDFGELLKPTGNSSSEITNNTDYWIGSLNPKEADEDDTTLTLGRISACKAFTEAITYFKQRVEQRIKDQSIQSPSASLFYSTSHLAVDTKNTYATTYTAITASPKKNLRNMFGPISEVPENDEADPKNKAAVQNDMLWVITVSTSTPRRVVEAAARAAGCTNFVVCSADDVSAEYLAQAIEKLNFSPPSLTASSPWRRWSRTSSIMSLHQTFVAGGTAPHELLSRNYFVTMRCGGTSTTITLYQTNNGIVAPLAQREHPVGSRCINTAFFTMLGDLIGGAERLQEYERAQPVGYNDLAVAVENRKRFVRPGDCIKLPLPCTFEQFYEHSGTASLETDKNSSHRSLTDAAHAIGLKFSRGLLELPHERLQTWFEPVCRQIAEALIDDAEQFCDLLPKNEHSAGGDAEIGSVFRSRSPASFFSNGKNGEKADFVSEPRIVIPVVLYGGFAESVILKNCISSSLLESPRSRSLRFGLQLVNVYVEPSLVPLYGALCHRPTAALEHQQQVIAIGADELLNKQFSVLRSRYTIGIGVMKPFDDTNDPSKKLVVKNGRKWCRDCFEILFTRNEAFTQYPQQVRRLFAPAMNSQENAVVKLYISAHTQPRYIDESEVRHVATLRVNFNSATPKLNRRLSMSFGTPEFDVMSVKSSNTISPKMLTTVTDVSPVSTGVAATGSNTTANNSSKRLSGTFSTKSTVITSANVFSAAEARRNSKWAAENGENVCVYIRLTISCASLQVVVEDAGGASMAQCSVAQWMVN